MQKVRILHSDYSSFNHAVGKIVMAEKGYSGWMIPVGESVKYDPDKLYRDEAAWPIESQPTLFFAYDEIEVINENPFEFWNKLKSGALHNAI